MARMPAEHRLGFGKRRQVLGADQALHGDRAQIGDFQIVARLERLDRRRLEADTEARRLIHEAEEHGFARGAERARLGAREQRIASLATIFHHHQFAADHIESGAVTLGELRQRGGIAAVFGGALDRARRIAEVRMRAEIGADGHAGIQPHGHFVRKFVAVKATNPAFEPFPCRFIRISIARVPGQEWARMPRAPRIAIIGGGIGGLAAALALERRGAETVSPSSRPR